MCRWDFKYVGILLFIVQSLCRVWLFGTQWTAALEAPLSSTVSWSLLTFMSIESVMLSNHLILCHPLLLLPSVFPKMGSFPMGWLFASGGQSAGASFSVSVLPVNIQGWFPLGLTGLRTSGMRILASCKRMSNICVVFFFNLYCGIIDITINSPILGIKLRQCFQFVLFIQNRAALKEHSYVDRDECLEPL